MANKNFDWRADSFTDFTFRIGAKEIRVHRNIVSHHSEVLKAMFLADMKEKKTGSVVIEDIDFDVMLALFNFIYDQTFDNGDARSLMQLMVAADKYPPYLNCSRRARKSWRPWLRRTTW